MRIFVDADAFIALMKRDDSNHTIARQRLEKLLQHDHVFVTSNYVFSEVVTVLSQRVSHDAAMQFIETFNNPTSVFTVRWVDEDIEAQAIEIFSQQTSKNTSFVDCINMAIIQRDGVHRIFSFDQIYRKNRLPIVGDETI